MDGKNTVQAFGCRAFFNLISTDGPCGRRGRPDWHFPTFFRIFISRTQISHFRNIILGLLFTCSLVCHAGQGTSFPGFTRQGDVFGTRCFIQNSTGLKSPIDPSADVLYTYEYSGEKIYFTRSGLVYEQVKNRVVKEEDEEHQRLTGEKEKRVNEEVSYIHMRWKNPDPSVQVIPSEKVAHYFSYGQKEFHAAGYKKIVYHDLYPGIDLEYFIPLDKPSGIKYNVLVKKGADLSRLVFSYEGASGRPVLQPNGDLEIPGFSSDITEHHPVCQDQSGQSHVVNFSKKGREIHFEMPELPTGDFVIDPWVNSNTALGTVWINDVDYDAAGNLYIYGDGTNSFSNPYKVAKYNPVGTLLWTFMGVATAQSFTASGGWRAGIHTDKAAGKVYIASRLATNVIRLDQSGSFDNYLTSGLGFSGEAGDLINLCNGNLLMLGGGNTTGIQYDINNGTIITSSKFQPSWSSCCLDIVDYAKDATGEVFVYYGSAGVFSNTIAKVAQSYTNTTWTVPSNFTVMQENNNSSNLAGMSLFGLTATWFDCMAVNMSYLYYYDGYNLAAYNKSTGAMISSTFINGQTARWQGGIAVDECNNLYLGGVGNILCMNFNGTTFNPLPSIPLNTTANAPYVSDMILNTTTNQLFVCGTGFTGVYSAIPSTTCPVNYCPCYQPVISFNTASTQCGNIGTSTVNVTGVPGPFSYTWAPMNVTGSVVTNLSPGTYTVSVSSLTCTGSFTAATTFTSALPPVNISITSNSINCATLGSATVAVSNLTPPLNYTWLPSLQTGSVATGLNPGIYTVIVQSPACAAILSSTAQFYPANPLSANISMASSVTCNGAATGTGAVTGISGGSATQNILWTNGASNYTTAFTNSLSPGVWSITVTDALTGCQIFQSFFVSQPSPVQLAFSSSSPSACAGSSISLSGSGSGGTPGYTYSWTAGPPSASLTVNQGTPGTYVYSLHVSDANNCGMTATTSVLFVANPVVSVSNTSVCPLASGTLTASGATSYTWNTNTTGSNLVAAPPANANYTVIGEAQTCTSTASGSILHYSSPVPQILSNSPRCQLSTLQINGSGGNTYLWSGPANFTSSASNVNIPQVNQQYAGVYNLTVTSVNGCTATANTNIVVNPTPAVSAAGSTICTSQQMNLSANSALALNYSWSGPAAFFSTAQNPQLFSPTLAHNGTYTVTAITANGCTNQAVANVQVISPPSLSVTLGSYTLCQQGINGSPDAVVITPSGATSYTVQSPFLSGPVNPAGPATYVSAVTPSQQYIPGTGTLTGSNGICTSTRTYSFVLVPNPIINLNSSAASICLGDSHTITVNGATQYFWQSAAPYTLTSNGASALTQPLAGTSFSVYGSLAGCNSATGSHTLSVIPQPALNIGPASPSICLLGSITLSAGGNGSSFKWSPGTGLNSTTTQTVKASPSGTQVYTVTATSGSCNSTGTVQVTVHALPVPTIEVITEKVCPGGQVRLTGLGGAKYEWWGPDQFHALGQYQMFTALSAAYGGMYTLTVTDARDCQNSTSAFVDILPLPEASSGNLTKLACLPYCGEYVLISPKKEDLQVKWNINHVGLGGSTARHCFDAPGIYTISAQYTSAVTSCSNSLEYYLTVEAKPIADFSYSPANPVAELDEVVFTDQSAGDIRGRQWTFAPDNVTYDGQTVVQRFQAAGNYPVALVVKGSGQCSDTIVKQVIVAEDFHVYIPNSFSPNHDHINDVFIPVFSGSRKYKLMVFDRWGELVFSTDESGGPWDGTFKGQACKPDSYNWSLDVTARNGEHKMYHGTVTLLK